MWKNNLTSAYNRLREVEEQTLEEFEDEYEDYFEEDMPSTMYNDDQRLDIQSLTDKMSMHLFRLTYQQMKSVVTSRQLTQRITYRANTSQQFHWDIIEAFAIMLRRLAYPSRLIDLELLFYNEGIRLTRNHLRPYNLRRSGEAIIQKGSPYIEVVGFIDGTLNAVCRPGENQGSLYNGHGRQHGLKYQAVVTPDGITVSLCGPFAGAIHDMNMLDSSDIVSELDEILNCEDIGDKFYALYGDPAYRPSFCLIRPFLTGLALTDNQRTTNEMMPSVRECVEWEFGHVATLFAFVRYRPGPLECSMLFQPF
ncbi:hypothetical protein INT47_003181 [Mucor saturninus]|uniref:DDE Tnp4 domain-containing protein n=1 Tax=Mucor saturninus TaxID=64648 RepID=A0A8H7UW80_9FUNG|nr:hypothetical protein INT47_003181 [Mucor saturninus]